MKTKKVKRLKLHDLSKVVDPLNGKDMTTILGGCNMPGIYCDAFWIGGCLGYGYGYGGTSGNGQDQMQILQNHISSIGGWQNWNGGYIAGVGYVMDDATVTAYSNSNQRKNTFKKVLEHTASALGLTSEATIYLTNKLMPEDFVSGHFEKYGASMFKWVGRTASGYDMYLNLEELLNWQNQTLLQNLEDIGQIGLGAVSTSTKSIGIGFAGSSVLAFWETWEEHRGY